MEVTLETSHCLSPAASEAEASGIPQPQSETCRDIFSFLFVPSAACLFNLDIPHKMCIGLCSAGCRATAFEGRMFCLCFHKHPLMFNPNLETAHFRVPYMTFLSA